MNALDFMTKFEEDCLEFYETLGSNEHKSELVSLFGLLAEREEGVS